MLLEEKKNHLLVLGLKVESPSIVRDEDELGPTCLQLTRVNDQLIKGDKEIEVDKKSKDCQDFG